MLQHRVISPKSLLLAGLTVLALAGAAACAQPSVGAGATGPGCVEDGAPQLGLPRERVTVQTARGPVALDLQVAADEVSTQKGLMFRRSMPANEGMLFDFGQARPLSFWMHNTYIPLDLIFVGADGRIVNIADSAQPCSDALIPSAAPARAVIELNAGAARRLGIEAGNRVVGQRIFPAR